MFVLKRVSLGLKWTYFGKFSEAKKKERLLSLATWLRLGLLKLGPTFIKARAAAACAAAPPDSAPAPRLGSSSPRGWTSSRPSW